MNWEYLSDEELDRLMKEVEEDSFCTAPEYLEFMILEKAKSYERRSHKTPARIRLLTYSIKIMAAAAAAVAVILIVPVPDREQALDYLERTAQVQQERMRDRMEERTSAELRNRTENRDRINAWRDFEERLEALTRWTVENPFSGRSREEPEGN